MKTIWWKIRLGLKILVSRFVCLIEFCHDCGVRQPLVWHADTALWLVVVGRSGGVYCPSCFDRRAEIAGVGLLRWTPVEDRP